jgi:hypothetical protein
MLGHASAATTLHVYPGLFDDDLGGLADRMTPRTTPTVRRGVWAPCAARGPVVKMTDQRIAH